MSDDNDNGNFSSEDEEDPNLYYEINYFDNDEEFNEKEDQDSDEKDMDKIKQHDIDHLTDKLIQNAQKLGLSKQDAFVKICGKISTLETPSISDTNRWFNGWEEENFDARYLTLIEKINDYYLSKSNFINFKTKFDNFSKFLPGSQRYEFEFNDVIDPIELCLFDNFHGKSKSFQFIDDFVYYYKIECVKKFHPIDQKHLIVFDSKTVSLVELDYKNETYSITSQKDCRTFGNVHILLDIEKPSNFVVFGQRASNDRVPQQSVSCFVQFGRILNDNELILVSSERMIYENRKFFCPTLNDTNILTVFEPFFGADGKWELACCVFDENICERQFLFTGTQNVNLEDLDDSTPFAWFEEECFVLMENKKEKNCLYSLNISTQICTMIYMNFPTFSSLHFDLDGNLAAKKDDEITVYFFKKPQKLDQIVWHEIRRQLVECGNNNFYENVMKKLPTNSEFRPFSVLK